LSRFLKPRITQFQGWPRELEVGAIPQYKGGGKVTFPELNIQAEKILQSKEHG
jgi:hypothetical protein